MRIFHPLRRPPVALLWAGLSLSAIGDQLYGVALTWIATGVFGAAAGYLSAMQALTILLVALLSGNWADRRDQLRFMLGADLARATVLVVLVTAWLAAGRPSALGLGATVVALAIGQALFYPAVQSVLPALVSEARLLPAANGLFDGTERSARLLGPGLIALLAGSIPLVHFMTIDAASFLVSAAALTVILRAYRPAGPSRRPGVSSVGLDGILRGVTAMRHHPLLGFVLATAGPVNGAWFAVFFLGLPLLLEQQGVHGLGTYGLLISVYGATNLLSNIVCGSRDLPRRPQFQMFGSNLLVGAGMASFALFGALPSGWRLGAYVVASGVSGIAGPLKDIPVAVLRQSRIAAADIPAAARAGLAVNNMGILVTMVTVPLLLRVLPLAPVVFGCGAVVVGIGVLGLVRHAAWEETTLG